MMKNEIEVRTNKREYNPGENICGAVYLRIINPTGGTGVQVKFHGISKFSYIYTSGVDKKGYREQRDYINFPNERLFYSDEPFSIGNKLFPFRIELSRDIPGTFEAKGETQYARWHSAVEYLLEVEVINATELRVGQSILVLHPLTCKCPSYLSPRPSHEAFPIRSVPFLKFFKKNIHITARLHNHIHRTGENIRLRIIITNNSRVPVESLQIKLLRKIIFTSRQPILEEFTEDENVDASESALDICVEKDVVVGNEQTIPVGNRSEFDNILFPLREVDGRPVYPTVRCSCITCEYKLCITAHLTNGSSFDTFVPVPVVNAEKDKQWDTWKAPMWVTDEDIVTEPSDDRCMFRVPENILGTESFATIPGFQPL